MSDVHDENEELESEKFVSIDELLFHLPLFNENLFLSMQAQNVMIIDFSLRDYETDLLQEYMRSERTPVQMAMYVSALSQMWVFGLYELLRTWRQMVRELQGQKGAYADRNDEDRKAYLDLVRDSQRERFRTDETFRYQLNQSMAKVQPMWARLDALRVNLAKHEVKGGRGFAASPGYGRISMMDGSIQWMVELPDKSMDIVTRREIADALRNAVGAMSS